MLTYKFMLYSNEYFTCFKLLPNYIPKRVYTYLLYYIVNQIKSLILGIQCECPYIPLYINLY